MLSFFAIKLASVTSPTDEKFTVLRLSLKPARIHLCRYCFLARHEDRRLLKLANFLAGMLPVDRHFEKFFRVHLIPHLW